jgi:hypothetical protein
MIGPVVVRTVAGGHLQPVGVVVGAHEMIRGGLARRVGGVRLVLLRLVKARVIRRQGTVDLVRGHVVEAVRRAAAGQPHGPRGLEQAVGADNVGLDERIGATDRAVNVAFRGKVHDRGHRFVTQQGRDRLLIADVALDKAEPGVTVQGCEARAVAGVGERIQDDQPIRRVLAAPVVREIGADKSGATGNEECFSHRCPLP